MKLNFFKTAIILVAVFCFGVFCAGKALTPSFIVKESTLQQAQYDRIKFGSEVAWKSEILTGKNYALLTNAPSQYHFNLLDSLIAYQKIAKIFSPEHGFATDHADGIVISKTENYKGIPVVSLYGKHLSPDSLDFQDVDTVLIDIQDVGLRFYTYISTVAKVLESAGKYKVPVVLLDRPNPLNGEIVEGPIVEDSLKSFVGYLPIPIRYGLTSGELFTMAVQQKWLVNSDDISLSVVRMENWKRFDYWKDLNIPWIATSPNLPTFESVVMYSGTCLFEGTNISEGRGTDSPFLWIGADFLTDQRVETKFGISASPEIRKPVSIRGKAVSPKFENQTINGYRLSVSDWKGFSPLNWTVDFIEKNQSKITYRKHYYLLWGKSDLKFSKNSQLETKQFEEKRRKYFIY